MLPHLQKWYSDNRNLIWIEIYWNNILIQANNKVPLKMSLENYLGRNEISLFGTLRIIKWKNLLSNSTQNRPIAKSRELEFLELDISTPPSKFIAKKNQALDYFSYWKFRGMYASNTEPPSLT